MDAKAESAKLILKLYELRRDPTMREARSWFIGFHPESAQDIADVYMGEHSAYYRMVTSYWEMAASFVTHGAIDEAMFNDANGEHVVVFAKLEPHLAELRKMFNSPQGLANLEKVVMAIPNAAERLAVTRRLKAFSQRRGKETR
jgi:hypothetical protein